MGVSIVNPFVALDFVGRGIVARWFEPQIMIEKMLVFPANEPRRQWRDGAVGQESGPAGPAPNRVAGNASVVRPAPGKAMPRSH